jgi:RNA polymerase sigma factor (sigma-70 family)
VGVIASELVMRDPVVADVEDLWVRFRSRLARTAWLIGGPDPEEAVAAAFVRVLPALRRGGVDDPLAYWRRAVVNEVLSRRRALLGRRRLLVEQERPEAPGADDGLADALVMRNALATLPLPYRAVLVLRYYEGLDIAETARALGVNEGTVKSRTSRGLARLKEMLDE